MAAVAGQTDTTGKCAGRGDGSRELLHSGYRKPALRRPRTVAQLRLMRPVLLPLLGLALAAALPAVLPAQSPAPTPSRTYPQLVALFTEWRAFEEPPRVGGIPDYRPATNTRRLAGLTRLQQRLRANDTTG